ncbi:histidine phosphatase family protein [Leeia sp. TBRC 13508]|uniref:Histidine phosphatase family protein n=1 Tax=Leeia speluncae TaxID=2884804 RepID=A0ABS8D7D9_9NEIS|nr:histidine phosphatase family protein [Leeia speluncae]MCB6184062.1 histidine phosphatase family protein [Leeia speluncae]
MKTITHLCLIRHGETPWNVERRLQGHLDIPLNETGLSQAEQVAEHLPDLPYTALYASDLTRTRQTAAPLAKKTGLLPIVTSRLRERHYGILQGLNPEEMLSQYPEETAHYDARTPSFDAVNGESLQSLHDRITVLMDRLAKQHRGEYIILVTHGGVLDIVHRWINQQPLDTQREFPIPNAAYNWISHNDEDGWKIEAWADRSHLANTLDEL